MMGTAMTSAEKLDARLAITCDPPWLGVQTLKEGEELVAVDSGDYVLIGQTFVLAQSNFSLLV